MFPIRHCKLRGPPYGTHATSATSSPSGPAHPQEGTGAAEVDQVQAIGSEPRGEGHIEGVGVGGPVALHGAV